MAKSSKTKPTKVKPSLVVFHTKENAYSHYVGKKLTCQVVADGPMTVDQLEEFRLDPLKVLGEDEKQEDVGDDNNDGNDAA